MWLLSIHSERQTSEGLRHHHDIISPIWQHIEMAFIARPLENSTCACKHLDLLDSLCCRDGFELVLSLYFSIM